MKKATEVKSDGFLKVFQGVTPAKAGGQKFLGLPDSLLRESDD